MFHRFVKAAVTMQRKAAQKGRMFRPKMVSWLLSKRIVTLFGCTIEELSQNLLDKTLQGYAETMQYFCTLQNESKDERTFAHQIAETKKTFWHVYMLVEWFGQHKLRNGWKQYHYGE